MWLTLGESVAGTSHRFRNTPCQDAFRFARYGPADESLVIAVADGAGSAAHGEAGARRACDEFIREFQSVANAGWNREKIVDVFSRVRAALCQEAENLAVPPRQLACTALLALIEPTQAAFAQIGDGCTVIGDSEGYRVAFWPELLEYANATHFLTDDDWPASLQFESVLACINEVAVLTDGLQRLALDFQTRKPFTGFFGPLFQTLRGAADSELIAEQLRVFLDSERVNVRTDDDKTLVLAVRRS